MAKIVMGMGMSHSPMMTLEGSRWNSLIESDSKRTALYNTEGQKVTYQELDKQVNSRYKEQTKDEVLVDQHRQMKEAFNRLHADFKEIAPDVVLVIVNDHPFEWFEDHIMPALAVYHGDEVVSAEYTPPPHYTNPVTIQQMAAGMGMDQHYRWPGSKETAMHVMETLMDNGFDVCAMKERKEDGSKIGHGHGCGMVVTEVMRENITPMVPIYLSITPPTDIAPSRCYDIGIALKKAIEEMPNDLRVGIIASGGLSHFVTDKDIDEQVIQALKDRDEQALRNLPRHRLRAGNSEIRNWITLEAAIRDLSLDWIEYIPVFRTPAGTGIGMAFGRWS